MIDSTKIRQAYKDKFALDEQKRNEELLRTVTLQSAYLDECEQFFTEEHVLECMRTTMAYKNGIYTVEVSLPEFKELTNYDMLFQTLRMRFEDKVKAFCPDLLCMLFDYRNLQVSSGSTIDKASGTCGVILQIVKSTRS